MVPEIDIAGLPTQRIVLDDHRRLPWRFYGRFTASIAAGL
jgi:hypothetical protein